MSDTYDPYRNAVRQTLQEKATEKRKKIFVIQNQKTEKAKKFFQKKIYLTDFIDLPEGLINIVFLTFFIIIPYFIGAIFTFIVLAEVNFRIYESMHNPFAFLWVIGYEFLATILLLIIVKSAITFK
jgi:ABC-type bacteriocin/lantibiotic exporter with double-glycine peptidase domain